MHTLLLDLECYRNYFLCKFRRLDTGAEREYELHDDCPTFDVATVRSILRTYKIVTFNGNNYDMPMLMYALKGATNAQLKAASDWIIVGNNRGWQFEQQFDVKVPAYIDHIDLIEVAFGQGSLKLYGGRLHSRKLQDLPIEPDATITPEQRVLLRSYCTNDLVTTGDLYNHLKPQIELRVLMSAGYGIDLRSKSDAQIAEAVIKKEVAKLLNVDRVEKPNVMPGVSFKYRAPAFIQFKTPALQHLLTEICDADFVIGPNGAPIEPPALDGRKINLGGSVYRMGIGGLHSSETSVAHYADENTILLDRDVASYYPAIVLNCNLYPRHLTEAFLTVYRDIFKRRIAAKRAGHKTTADTLKIVLNGSFGKLGSKWSALYAPDLLIQVTVTGQLALLMLIEWLESVGIPVVSANTDGIVIKCPKSRKEELDSIVGQWEKRTGFDTEETLYRALFSRDINNYIALKAGGGFKGKGAFAEVTISKNPDSAICNEAVAACIEHGTPIGETILKCRDVRKFVTVRTVRGGAIKITDTKFDDSLTTAKKRPVLLTAGWTQVGRDQWQPHGGGPVVGTDVAYRMHCGKDTSDYIGKVVRFYYAVGERGALHYKIPNKTGNHNKVPSSDGAKPLMELPDDLPTDINYGAYMAEANNILKQIGARHG